MNNSNAEPRFNGDTDRTDLLTQPFQDRLERFRETSGLTWSALARSIDVDRKRARLRRRKGGK